MSGFQELKEGQSDAQDAKVVIGIKEKRLIARKLRNNLTQEEVRREFNYDPETGILTAAKTRGRGKVKKDSVAGYLSPTDGYLIVGIGYNCYFVHRIIWLWVYGYLPENEIDHINRDRTDNRLCNLREVSRVCNVRNSKPSSLNITGVRGVSYQKSRGKYIVQIGIGRKVITLCRTADFIEAVAHRLAAEQCIDWVNCDESTKASKIMDNYLRRSYEQGMDGAF